MREKLAKLCHEQWSGWMKYLFSKCDEDVWPGGEVLMPSDCSDRWFRQMNTPYEELSQKEQESDRKEADKFLAVMGDEFRRLQALEKRVKDKKFELEMKSRDRTCGAIQSDMVYWQIELLNWLEDSLS